MPLTETQTRTQTAIVFVVLYFALSLPMQTMTFINFMFTHDKFSLTLSLSANSIYLNHIHGFQALYQVLKNLELFSSKEKNMIVITSQISQISKQQSPINHDP